MQHFLHPARFCSDKWHRLTWTLLWCKYQEKMVFSVSVIPAECVRESSIRIRITHYVQTTTQGRFQWFALGSGNSLGPGMVQDEVRWGLCFSWICMKVGGPTMHFLGFCSSAGVPHNFSTALNSRYQVKDGCRQGAVWESWGETSASSKHVSPSGVRQGGLQLSDM